MNNVIREYVTYIKKQEPQIYDIIYRRGYNAGRKKHGHWENVRRILEEQEGGGFFQGQCSRCHRYSYQPIGWGGHMDLEYCSCCGAKMDEVVK